MFTQVITARKRTEQALAESEGRYRALIDWSPEAISVQRDGKVIYVNPAGVKLAGVKSAQDLIGRSILDLVHPDSRPVVLERMKKSLTEGVGQPLIEEKLLRPDGTVVIVEIQGTPIIYDGKPALYSSMRDITARRIAEEKIHQLNVELEQRVSERTAELVAANKELEAFSYSVSHDLRAPLRAVDGFSQAVVNDYGSLLPADGLRQLQVIRQGAQRMGALIDDLLSFSRLSRQPLKKQPVDTGQLVRAVLAELNPPGAAGRPVTIRLGELPAGEGDPALLRQVWVNLIANALKYTGKRDQAVVEIGCLAPPEEHVYFVRDNGSGFDMRYAGKLFGVFQRLHRAEDYEGTGVGLAIVQRIVHRHGGRVWAEAAVDRGATFYFTLKAKPQP
jgi:PAS domain S-box-containing protein